MLHVYTVIHRPYYPAAVDECTLNDTLRHFSGYVMWTTPVPGYEDSLLDYVLELPEDAKPFPVEFLEKLGAFVDEWWFDERGVGHTYLSEDGFWDYEADIFVDLDHYVYIDPISEARQKHAHYVSYSSPA